MVSKVCFYFQFISLMYILLQSAQEIPYIPDFGLFQNSFVPASPAAENDIQTMFP